MAPLVADVFRIIEVFDELSGIYRQLTVRVHQEQVAQADTLPRIPKPMPRIPKPVDKPQLPPQEFLPSECVLLGITTDAPREVAEAAYKALAKRHHPDVGGDAATMQRINVAYEAYRQRRGWSKHG